VLHLASLRELAKGTSAGGREGLSEAHWELFHDVQLAERCLRRSAGDHDNNNNKISADGDGGSPDKLGDKPLGDKPQSYVPAGMVRPVDPPPPIDECPGFRPP
jgi:exportin-5